jgi:hypothetical protein
MNKQQNRRKITDEDVKAEERAKQRIILESEAPDEPDVAETGRRHPTVAPGTDWSETGTKRKTGDHENHSRRQGIGYGRGSSDESRNDHMYNSVDDDQ